MSHEYDYPDDTPTREEMEQTDADRDPPECICEHSGAGLYNPDCYWHGTEGVDPPKTQTKRASVGRGRVMQVVPINSETWLICGGRDFANQGMFDSVMSQVVELRGCPRSVVHGCALGADQMAAAWGRRMAINVHGCSPDWKTHGKAGGPIRNQMMLDDYKPQVVIAFPGGSGTADMVRRAHATQGIDVIEVKPNCR